MIRVRIVDDEPLPRTRIRALLSDRGGVEIVGECQRRGGTERGYTWRFVGRTRARIAVQIETLPLLP